MIETVCLLGYSAVMQKLDWNDLTYLLALHRAGNLSAAARMTGSSDTTVARRIRALEHALGQPLFSTSARGRYILTPAGQAVLARAEAMERESAEMVEALGQTAEVLDSVVTISAVPILCHRILLPALAELHRVHPQLTVELIPDGRNYDLNKREADLALRFSRPERGGLKVKAVKLGTLDFAVFGPAGMIDPGVLPWVLYGESVASLPQAHWTASVLEQNPEGKPAPVRVTDAETALEAAALGLGKAVLPSRVGHADARLQSLSVKSDVALPTRDVWLLSHVDQNRLRSVQVVKEWVSEIEW